jgi:hypothetical protein
VVHDGVLQVLALVQRRGAELGGEAAELGRLAGEQEVTLRALVQAQESSVGKRADRRARPRRAGDRTAGPHHPEGRGRRTGRPGAGGRRRRRGGGGSGAGLPAQRLRPRGNDARAWVLLEDLGSEVMVSVRDDGPGIAGGRLDQAAAEGRLGVSESIRGRVAGLGGTATLTSAPGQGTEWEFTIPKKGRP